MARGSCELQQVADAVSAVARSGIDDVFERAKQAFLAECKAAATLLPPGVGYGVCAVARNEREGWTADIRMRLNGPRGGA